MYCTLLYYNTFKLPTTTIIRIPYKLFVCGIVIFEASFNIFYSIWLIFGNQLAHRSHSVLVNGFNFKKIPSIGDKMNDFGFGNGTVVSAQVVNSKLFNSITRPTRACIIPKRRPIQLRGPADLKHGQISFEEI